MRNKNIPSDVELPSSETLMRSTLTAVLVAAVLLVVAILPAEYGIDPTGIGEVLSLRRMGEIKVSHAQEAAVSSIEEAIATGSGIASSPKAEEPTVAPGSEKPATTILSHEMKVDLVPNEGKEIKVVMTKGSKVRYTWWTGGGRANFDVHGDSKKLNINYHSYSKGSDKRSEGVIEAAFDGNHGWFWRNRTSSAIAITLRTSGEYTDILRVE